ncbi:hypothetical protein LRR18_18145, partial [Mangrovimonas sp. AS39]|uniref:hypothetical protein n=1 Tax=Mangrovimonas futianensis TaxID=2895523 RepID=UPI001E28CAA1
IYGLAIADRSEVRAVRLYVRQGGGGMPGAGVTFSRTSRGMAPAGSMELVEGAPLFGFELDPESQVALDRLDRHDGRLVLVAALTPEAAYALPRTI